MKKVKPALANLLMEYMTGKRTTMYLADLYTFKLNNGTLLRYTGHDVDLIVGGNKYISWPIERGDINEERGVRVTEMDLTVYFAPTDVVYNGITWYQGFQGGLFDNCYLIMDRVYSPDPWQYFMPPIADDYVLHGRFVGRMDISELHMTSCDLKVKSVAELLNVQLPRNLLMPSCLNTLFDSMCGLSQANYAVNGAVQGTLSPALFGTNLTQADGYFDGGTITFTSGTNTGVTRTVKAYATGNVSLFLPLYFTPAVGDTFVIYPGCDHTLTTCQNKFNNVARFRGFPFIPVPETVL